ncbi:MAG: hypothetical protein IIU55_03285 [Paludibacteraceae bacterium]|nr:hypothetical protein [Paludibacteraceae bacterium]
MTKQETAIKYIQDNYLAFNRLRHDIVSDKLQIRLSGDRAPQKSADFSGTPLAKGEGQEYWCEMSKHDINSIVCHAAQEYDANITSREVMTALQSDLIPDVHPLREYVLSCREWTEEQPDWIDMVAQQVTVRPSPLSNSLENAASGYSLELKGKELWRRCFKKWFVAMVASWMKDEVVNHQVLVLIGRQGIYKTTWLEHLIPPHLRDYCCKLANATQLNKDDRLRIAEFGLINLDELDAMTPRELNAMKSIITATDVNERAAYGYTKERRIRLASFCASSNRREFLTDITGNRRWLPFEVENIQNPFFTTLPYEQMYAEAWALAQDPYFSYWFDLEDIDLLEEHNETFRAQESEEDLLPILFDIPAEGKGQFMTTAQISERLVTYGNIKKPMSLSRLGMVLSKVGYSAVQRSINGVRGRGWIVYQRNTDEINALKSILKDG